MESVLLGHINGFPVWGEPGSYEEAMRTGVGVEAWTSFIPLAPVAVGDGGAYAYYDGYMAEGGGYPAVANGGGLVPLATPATAGAIVLTLAGLTAKFGPGLAKLIWPLLKSIAIAGGLVGAITWTASLWGKLPTWAQALLIALGVGIGTKIILGLGGNDEEVPAALGAAVIGTWEANGITFYRLADGRIAVKNTKGRWKIWRPRRPIVLYAGGASNLRTLLRADQAAYKQLKKLNKAIARRGIGRSTRRALPPGTRLALPEQTRIVNVE